MPQDIFTLREVAKLLQVSEKTVTRWAESGRLASCGKANQPKGVSGLPTLIFRRQDVQAFQANYKRKRQTPRTASGGR